MELKLRPKEECRFDAVSLGEIMLRLDPGEGRIRTARSFRAWEGGGEYNVVRGLHKCFGMKTGVITAFADNEVGKLMRDFIEQGAETSSWDSPPCSVKSKQEGQAFSLPLLFGSSEKEFESCLYRPAACVNQRTRR